MTPLLKPTSVDVDGAPHDLRDHAAALYVPPGAPRPPGRWPAGLARLGRLPEGKVRMTPLSAIDVDALPRPG